MQNKVSFTFYLDPAQMKKLKARSEKTGAPIAFLIRKAIDAATAQWQDEK